MSKMFYNFVMRSCLLQIDKADDPERLQSEAEQIGAICISAISGDGLEQFSSAVQAKLKVSICLYLRI